MMTYRIHSHGVVKEGGEAVRRFIVIEVTFTSGATLLRTKEVALDSDLKTEAAAFAAELDETLEDRLPMEREEHEISEKDRNITKDALDAAKVALQGEG